MKEKTWHALVSVYVPHKKIIVDALPPINPLRWKQTLACQYNVQRINLSCDSANYLAATEGIKASTVEHQNGKEPTNCERVLVEGARQADLSVSETADLLWVSRTACFQDGRGCWKRENIQWEGVMWIKMSLIWDDRMWKVAQIPTVRNIESISAVIFRW